MLGALAVVVVAALPGHASALGNADAPCWKRVTLDWAADGVVNQTYPLACYQQAINHLQPDQKLYSSAEDDIRRALQRAIADKNNPNSPTTTPQPDTKTGDGGGVPVPLLVLGGLAIVLVGGRCRRPVPPARPRRDLTPARTGRRPGPAGYHVGRRKSFDQAICDGISRTARR